MINFFPGISTGVVFLLDCWRRLYELCPFIWLVSPDGDAVELTLQLGCKVDFIFLFMVLDPTDSRTTTSCCSRRNAWKPRIHPRRRLSAFGDLSLKLTCCCISGLNSFSSSWCCSFTWFKNSHTTGTSNLTSTSSSMFKRLSSLSGTSYLSISGLTNSLKTYSTIFMICTNSLISSIPSFY